MSTFAVTPGELESAAAALSGVAGQLANVGDVGAVNAGAAENAQLEAAISAFVMTWVTGMRGVSQALSVVTGNVSSGAGAYHGTDAAISGTIGR